MKIKCLLVTVFLFFSNYPLFSQTDSIFPKINVGPHPRILLFEGEEQTIKKTLAADNTWNKIHTAIITECDNLLNIAPVERIQVGRRLLDKSRECLRRVFDLSYAWRMTGNTKYFQRAEKELLAL